MTDTKLIASLFDRLNQNQLALGAAVEELSNWVEQRGSADIAITCAARWKRSTRT
ncbi:hypothetical protein [Pseudomonas syringae]